MASHSGLLSKCIQKSHAALEAMAKSTVDKYLADTKFAGTYSVDPVAGSASGNLVTVTVTAPSSLLVLDVLVPAIKDLSVSAETTMKME